MSEKAKAFIDAVNMGKLPALNKNDLSASDLSDSLRRYRLGAEQKHSGLRHAAARKRSSCKTKS